MARRRLTLKRIDPWSVLKFGFVANLALLAIWLLGAGIVWFFVRQLELIEKVCEIAGDVGFVECGVNGGNLFRALLLLGLLGTVIQTGLVVFLAFLHNLIADLVGGISFTYTEEGGSGSMTSSSGAVTASRSGSPSTQKQPVGAASRSSSSSSSAPSGSEPAGSASGASGAGSGAGSSGSGASSAAPAGGWSGGDTSGQGSSGSTSPTQPSPSAPSSPGPSPSQPSQGSSQPNRGANPGSGRGPGQSSGSPSDSSSSSGSGDWDLFGPRGSGGSGS